MKKRLKRLLNKKGLTLVEILVVLIITSILLACAMGMLTPVNNLMNSIKGNAHMDTMCDTVNEYIRGSMEKAEAVSIIIFPDTNADWSDSDDTAYMLDAQNKIMNAWVDLSDKYKASEGYQLRALGVMQNYNKDFRLFDFGDVTDIDYTWWGGETGTVPIILKSDGEATPGRTFLNLLEFRDGGGRNRTWESPVRSGLNGDEFGWFSAFNDEFYSNGIAGNNNYSIQVAFEAVSGTLPDGSADGVNYLTVSTQMFRRKGNTFSSDPNEKILTFEPTNQVKSLSFKMLNGAATMSSVSGTINKVDTVNGVKQIVSAQNDNGKYYNDNVVILYVVRDIDAYYTMTTAAAP
ncbi:MAG: prepilin-type N-terminal cleavage/methylation domain-containing protein [Ruminococcaceae bacterium]|nr:prepilin-type N-terminal cleavage/methylation domain-containing protein [Oscillospiraceae bacterium]